MISIRPFHKKLLLVTLLAIIIWISVLKPKKITEVTNEETLIPNVIHYVVFDKTSIDFVFYLSLLSALKIQKPERISIHCNCDHLNGEYWDKIKQIDSNKTITLNIIPKPTHVFGQLLSSVYHASDVTRILILKSHGGIYLDSDVIIINNLDGLRNYDMVVGLPKQSFMGTQVLLSKPEAQFLSEWLDGYRKYKPTDWYYNAGKYPTEILRSNPSLAHKVEVYFGVHYLLKRLHTTLLWNEWKRYYTIHLLSRHEPSPKSLDENIVRNLTTNFGKICQWVLNLT